jgi:flavin reductase (DIM6/NTAB) family NADH-FMN oxidoreductase RutF
VYVLVDLTQDPPVPQLRDPEDFTAFKLTARGKSDAPTLDAALGDLGHIDPAGEHAWLTLGGLRALAGELAASAAWSDDFEGMVRYAGSRGWLSAEGDAVRAHIEREPSSAARALDQAVFRDVIGRFASGVTVITTTVEDRDFGTTASAVSSLSMEPPMLLICLNRTSETREAIAKSDRFAVNILSEGQAEIASAFARKSPDKFAQAKVDRGPHGMPLIPGSLAQLECIVTETAVGGTHTVFFGEVRHAEGTDDAPLTYYRGRFGRFEDLH